MAAKKTIMGFKESYISPIENAARKTNSTKLNNCPTSNTQGLYINFIIGTAL